MVVPNSGLGAGPLAHIKSTSMTFVIGLPIRWANRYHLASTTEPALIIPVVILLGMIPKTSPDFDRNFLHNHWGSRPRVLPLVGLFCRKVIAICFGGPHQFLVIECYILNRVARILLARRALQDGQYSGGRLQSEKGPPLSVQLLVSWESFVCLNHPLLLMNLTRTFPSWLASF